MKIKLFSLTVLASIAAWCPPSFAQQVINGATPTALSPTGVTAGVAMTGQGGGGTLIVGTIGGPEADIFTNNSSSGNVTNPLLKAVSTDASSLSNIVFNSSSNVYGAIGVTNPGGPFFLNINGANNGTTDNFDGNLYGTITTVSGTGSLNFNSGSTNITATNFAADGTISLAPNTTVIGALTTNTANTGTLVLGSGSVLTGAVGGANGLKAINVVGGSNTAGVSASISGAVNAYSFNLGTNRLNIGGALTIANSTSSGVINTTLASPTVYGNIRPVGATNLGSTLLVNVTVPSTAVFPVGTVFNIVQTQTGTVQSGTNGSVVSVTVQSPTNPLYTFSAVPPAGTVAGLVAITTTGIPLTAVVTPPAGVTPPVIAPVAAPVVPVVIAVAAAAPPTSPIVTTVVPAINALAASAPSPAAAVAAVASAVAQLAPSYSALAAPLVTFEGTRAFQNLLSSHLDEGLCAEGSQAEDRNRPDGQRGTEDQRRPNGETSNCPENNQYSGLWAKGFGYFGDQGAQGAFLGYGSRILGVMVGYDTALNYDTRIGLGVGYARSTIHGNTFNSDTDFNTYQGTLYINHETGTWVADGDISYGWNHYSGIRRISFTGVNYTADAKYGGEDLTGLVTLGYHFFDQEIFDRGITITPLASLQATHVGLNAYTETGASDLDLTVNSQDYTFLESGLGANVASTFDAGDGKQGLPEIHFKWLYELVNPTFQNTAALTAVGSPSFTSAGLQAAATTLNIGAGLTLLSCACETRTWSVEAVYDFYWRTDNYSANQATLEASYRF